MGVYLSEPNKEKHIAEGQNKALSFVTAEMQGMLLLRKDGERLWKMPPFTTLILGMGIHYSQFLMGMEVL
jgi:hypothetical protein